MRDDRGQYISAYLCLKLLTHSFARLLCAVEKPKVLLNARSVHFGRNTGPLVKQRREMTLILKTYT